MQTGVEITVNGKPRRVPIGTTLAGLVADCGLDRVAVAVERNHALVRSKDRAAVTLAEGDEIEVVTLVGGG
ncbi:MAG TPA: sulfur carrier protein ThiS [Planctomycetota bacterium]|nr:sulfur carrier protein ThiS [Planctomycetota bacterium]